jgi:hypothetical protein
MEQARHLPEQPKIQSEREPAKVETVQRSEPQPLDDEVLRHIGGGTQAPRGNW